MDTFKEFLESSTIHGLVYISTSRRLLKLFWLLVVITGFTGAGVLIHQSFSSWAVSPVSTTIETLSITELDFPNVTVCPPRNTFTSLNPDLVMARNLNFDEETRKEAADIGSFAVFNTNLRVRYEEFAELRQQQYQDVYTGCSDLVLPYREQDGWYNYRLRTARLSGSFSSPHFRQTFHQSRFERKLYTGVCIDIPQNISRDSQIFLDIEYDVDMTSYNEEIYVDHHSESRDNKSMKLDKTQTTSFLIYPIGDYYEVEQI